MPSEPAISVRGVGKYYEFEHTHEWSLFGRRKIRAPSGKGHRALSDITFEVPAGQAVGVIGRNGAGKSTLLQILTGSLRPTEGEVVVNGRVAALLELGAGFNPEFTGRENIFLAGAVLSMSEREISSRYQEIINFADIGEFIDNPVKSYSSGMMVRLAFSLQVHIDPDILIVDEALSVGDIFFQQKCITKIREILSRGATLLFVSHGLNSVKSLCSRAIHLQNGLLIADGPSAEVCDAYQNSTTSISLSDWRLAVQASKMAGDEIGIIDLVDSFEGGGKEIDPDFAARLSQRSGSGDVQFTGLLVLDEAGRQVVSIEHAGKVKLCAYLHACVDIPEGAAIGVLLRDANGVDLIAFNSDFYGWRLPALDAGSDYVWQLEVELPLARGFYSLHVGIKPSPTSEFFYDRCFNAALLEVLGNPVTWGQYGGRIIHVPEAVELRRVVTEYP